MKVIYKRFNVVKLEICLAVEFLPFSSAVLKYSVGGMRGNKLGTNAGLSSFSFSSPSDIGSSILRVKTNTFRSTKHKATCPLCPKRISTELHMTKEPQYDEGRKEKNRNKNYQLLTERN